METKTGLPAEKLLKKPEMHGKTSKKP